MHVWALADTLKLTGFEVFIKLRKRRLIHILRHVTELFVIGASVREVLTVVLPEGYEDVTVLSAYLTVLVAERAAQILKDIPRPPNSAGRNDCWAALDSAVGASTLAWTICGSNGANAKLTEFRSFKFGHQLEPSPCDWATVVR
jgi:hypothetical protein